MTSANTTTIFDLPTEIILHIFSLLTPSFCPDLDGFDGPWRPLRLACLQWKNVADVLFYSHLTVRSPNSVNGLLKLQRRMQEMDAKPHRWKYLHSLSLHAESDSDWSHCVSFIKEATGKGSVLHQLALSTKLFPLDESLLETITVLPLKSLDLSGVTYGIGLQTIWKYFNLPTLQHISLCLVTWSEKPVGLHKSTSFHEIWLSRPDDLDIEYQALNCRDGYEQTSHIGNMQNLKSMAISIPAGEPDLASLLLLWPSNLKNLSLRSVHLGLYGGFYSALVIGSLLSLHSDSLETIELPPILDSGLPELYSFHKLTNLHLHATSFFNTAPFDTLFKLSAPLLRRLTIDFCQRGLSTVQEFGSSRAAFLKQFIVTQNRRHLRIPLRERFLQFGPKSVSEDDIVLELWSADLVEEVSATAFLFDIFLAYNKPVYIDDGHLCMRTVLNRNQRMIYDILLKSPTIEGMHIDDIRSILGLSHAEVESTLDEMLMGVDPYVYTTIDAETYALLENP